MAWGILNYRDLSNYNKKMLDKLEQMEVDPNSPIVRISKGGGLFSSKDIYVISLSSSKIFEEDQYEPTRNRLIVEKCTNGLDTLDYIYGFADVGYKHFSKYLIEGKYFFIDGLPDATINSTFIPTDKVKSIIENEINSNINILESSYSVISDIIWCMYNMQELYDYNIGNDILIYNNKYYYYLKEELNNDSTKYTVYFNTIKSINKDTYRTTTITITSKDENTDIKTTSIDLITNIYKGDTGVYLYNETINESTVTEEIPKNSSSSSSTYEYIESSTESFNSETISFEIDTPSFYNNFYIIKYINLSSNRGSYWVYDPSTNKYPELDTSSFEEEDKKIEVYPIAALRIEYNDIKDDRKDSTDSLLNSVGTSSDVLLEAVSENEYNSKIKDVFFLMGITPNDKDPIVSKALYNMIDYVYNKYTSKEDSLYSLSIKEQTYENDIAWSSVSPTIKEEKLLELGECTHESKYSILEIYRYIKVVIKNDSLLLSIIEEKKIRNGPLISISTIQEPKEYNINSSVSSDSFIPSCFSLQQNDTTKGYSLSICKDILNKRYDIKAIYDYKLVSSNDGSVPFYDVAITNPDGSISYYVYIDGKIFIPFEDINENKEIISNKVLIRSYATTDLIVTKQINKEQTKTYYLSDFKGSHFIPHKKGGSFIILNSENKELIIPLTNIMLNNLSIIEQTKLLDNAIHLHIYAFDHTHLKWYETGAFGALIKIISIGITVVVSIISMGSLTQESITLSAILWGMLEKVAIGVALTLAIKTITSLTDSLGLRILLSVTATAAATYYINGSFEDFSFIDAVNLGNTAVDAVDTYIEQISSELQNVINSFSEKYSEKLELFEDIFEGFNSGLSVSDVVNISINSENNNYVMYPSAFYYLALDAYKDYDILYSLPEYSIYNFVDNKLKLTIGEDDYE